jgi:hypothetical protein
MLYHNGKNGKGQRAGRAFLVCPRNGRGGLKRLGVMKPSPVVQRTLSRDDPPAFYGTVLLRQLDSHE